MAPQGADEREVEVVIGGHQVVAGLQELREAVHAVHHERPDPGQVVEADVVQPDPVRGHVEPPGERALEPDRHVAQAQRAVARVQQGLGHDPHGVREVQDPAAWRASPLGLVRDLEDQWDGAQRLGEATGPGRLLAQHPKAVGERLVDEAGRLAAHPQLEERERGTVERGAPVAREHEPARPALPPEDPVREPAHDVKPFRVGIQQDELVDRQDGRPAREPLHELRGVGAASADNGDLQAHRHILTQPSAQGEGLTGCL